MSSSKIKQLLKNHSIWQASQSFSLRPAISTGYSQLDKQLHYSGWPQAAMCELSVNHWGTGELRLLMPCLTKLSQKPGYICWINPPYLPYAPALSEYINLSNLVIIEPKTNREIIWAAQQALSSNACSAVLIWLFNKVSDTQIRKLSLAAKTGNCWGFILRCDLNQEQASSAALKISLKTKNKQQELTVIKQPGGWAGQKLTLDLFPERRYWNFSSGKNWPLVFN